MPTATSGSASVERFWSKVNKTDDCWLWTASTVRGYGQFHVAYADGIAQHLSAHRYAWEHFNGPIPDGLSVLHRCDQPLCVNPIHLFLGTQSDNLHDASRKGRLTVPRDFRLTLEDRLEIMAAPRDRATGGALARKFGVSKTSIHQCRRGRFVGSGVYPIRGEVA